jgi:hypothetical protein
MFYAINYFAPTEQSIMLLKKPTKTTTKGLLAYLPFAICIFGIRKTIAHFKYFNAILNKLSFFINPDAIIFLR